MLDKIYSIITSISQWAVAVIPILTLMGLCVPKVREWLAKKLESILGLQKIEQSVKEGNKVVEGLKQELVDVRKEISELKEKTDLHIEKDKDKIEGLKCSLKACLLSSFHFYIERGYITFEELSVLQDVFDAYLELHGNGAIKAQWENKILKLPIHK